MIDLQKRRQINLLSVKISAAKKKLNQTGIKALKYADGLITDEEYAETKAARALVYAEIEALDAVLKELEETENDNND